MQCQGCPRFKVSPHDIRLKNKQLGRMPCECDTLEFITKMSATYPPQGSKYFFKSSD